MSEEQYTRCPACKTVFRVTEAQLALRDGMVRCGHCQTIFDGRGEMISLAPTARTEEDAIDEALLGPPTVTLRSSRALQPVTVTRRGQDVEPRVEPRVEPHLADPDTLDGPASLAPPTHHGAPSVARTTLRGDDGDDEGVSDEVDFEHRFAWEKPKARKPRHTWAWGLASFVLALLLIGQVLHHFRDAIAAHWPATRPALVALCKPLRCEVRPLRDVGALSIEASDLQVDPAHKGLLVLSATVRNRAAYAIAYPHLELTLTDASDQVVVRRAFAPGEYIGGTVDLAAGLAGNGEAALKLFIDASATQQAGYRLYLFYP